MIEIINENRISAEKIIRETNEEEHFYLMKELARLNPKECLKAVTEAVNEELEKSREAKV